MTDRTRDDLVKLVGEDAADNYLSFRDNSAWDILTRSVAQLTAERDQLKAQIKRINEDAEVHFARQHAADRDNREQHDADVRKLANDYEAKLDRLSSDLADMTSNFESTESEAEQLRTLVQALKFDTNERDRLEKALAQSQRDYLNIADALLPTSSSPQDLIDRAHRLRSTLAKVTLERDQAISERDAARWADDTRRKACEIAIAERDAYRSMLCDLLASHHAYPAEHPAMERLWDRTRDLLKNGPAKP